MNAIARAALFAATTVLAGPALAQAPPTAPRPVRPAAPAQPAAQPASPAVPQQTTATFGDWVLRCARLGPAPGTPTCEIAQVIQRDGQPVAQIAIGRLGRNQPHRMVLLFPTNVTLTATPTLHAPGASTETDLPTLDLSWRRCLPNGCVADAPLAEEALNRIRGWSEPGRVSVQDGAGRPVVLPMSPRGLKEAFEALAKEDGG